MSEKWEEITRQYGHYEQAFERLTEIYHKAIADKTNVISVSDITTVLQMVEPKEINIIGQKD